MHSGCGDDDLIRFLGIVLIGGESHKVLDAEYASPAQLEELLLGFLVILHHAAAARLDERQPHVLQFGALLHIARLHRLCQLEHKRHTQRIHQLFMHPVEQALLLVLHLLHTHGERLLELGHGDAQLLKVGAQQDEGLQLRHTHHVRGCRPVGVEQRQLAELPALRHAAHYAQLLPRRLHRHLARTLADHVERAARLALHDHEGARLVVLDSQLVHDLPHHLRRALLKQRHLHHREREGGDHTL
mmetsp:Transcript_19660/g.49092  ORF Transcript_19660/g.49092 Transcript_19660/m.49092 type:complete len:244 (+) Transcript_19660:914-1645(+)